ncbi:hypothetical protein KIN20_006222 [Parelaphostrongylus tenuis]|uniref:Uncharacterized protein n=1 Tax=Parelaphostrongylus tenuis TaxID=148309 RepID=A0AAD5MMP4_PARTN|nr:hypothetical protein KIN20_006222 [Parelaphostrongylus tenuis]
MVNCSRIVIKRFALTTHPSRTLTIMSRKKITKALEYRTCPFTSLLKSFGDSGGDGGKRLSVTASLLEKYVQKYTQKFWTKTDIDILPQWNIIIVWPQRLECEGTHIKEILVDKERATGEGKPTRLLMDLTGSDRPFTGDPLDLIDDK